MSDYRAELGGWLGQNKNHMSSGHYNLFQSAIGDGKVSNDALYLMAFNLYNSPKSAPQASAPSESHLDLVPYTNGFGDVGFVDRSTNRVIASTIKEYNGLFSYHGPKNMLEVLFGRGGLDAMWRRTEDNNFFYDPKKRPEKGSH